MPNPFYIPQKFGLVGFLSLGLMLTLGCTDEPNTPVTATPSAATATPSPSGPIYVGSRNELIFEATDIGTEAGSATLNIYNIGSELLTVNSNLTDDANSQFAILEDVTEVAPGESENLTLTFTPSMVGEVTGTLFLTTNDPHSLEVAIALTAEGRMLDADEDGVGANDDCDDNNADIYPGATEICDGLDNNCDGDVDEGVEAQPYYPDADNDGYGDNSQETLLCETTDGFIAASGDCDDGDESVHPNATEICDGIDSNCDGIVDDDVTLTLHPDQDGDGFGDPNEETQACSQDGYTEDSSDCDDANPNTFPGAEELCDSIDNNCDGQTDEDLTGTFYPDVDADGFGDMANAVNGCGDDTLISTGGDCDDSNDAIHPEALELCDLIDNNCDGQIDEDLTGTFYTDGDGDGFGDDATVKEGCSTEGDVAQGGDCDDTNALNFPGAEERCDGIDNNCNTEIDEGLTGLYYYDGDGDGYGDVALSQEGCSTENYVDNGADCDDNDSTINPDAEELCDELDNNCDGFTDEDVTTTYYPDLDGDGFGEAEAGIEACEPLADTALNDDDCDDAQVEVNPDASEICDGQDNNCDGEIDENAASDAPTWYQDNDGDSYGIEENTTVACNRPNGYASLSGDCDDTLPAVNPGADESCGDDIDNNCDGAIDEDSAANAGSYYIDEDGDGFGLDGEALITCEAPSGYAAEAGDCNDDSSDFYPGAPESDCTDPNDYNCDGSTAFADEDDDGFPACEDCDDNNDTVKPNATEICDELDNNCNGIIDEGVEDTFYIDSDGDGYGAAYNSKDACEVPEGFAETGGDCNDFNASISPGSPELCDEVDNNCNGYVDEGLEEVAVYPDLDGDTHGAEGSRPLMTCLSDSDGDGVGDEAPYGYSLVEDDCDDSDVLIYTGAPELCDGEDNDCNGKSDEFCFEACEGEWPFHLDYSYSSPRATLVDMNGDNQFEVIIQDNFGFAILNKDGEPYYNYSAPVHNYSRNRIVTADIDTFYSFTADTQGVEILTGNGSKPTFYKLNGDRTVSVYTHDLQVYDASSFMASDIDGDGAPEFITSSWCQADKGVMAFDFDPSTSTIGHIGNIPDPDGVCEYYDGRTLTDLDGDGTAELVIGNGYAHPNYPANWSGQIYAMTLTNPNTLEWEYHCDPDTCFPTDIDDAYEGAIGSNLLRVGADIHTTASYFLDNIEGASNPIMGLNWYYNAQGEVHDGYPSSGYSTPFFPTDVDDDGTPENQNDVQFLGLWDVNGDGYPDRIYHAGDELRLALWDADSSSFLEYTESRLSPSGQGIVVRSIWDSDGDGRLNVISSDSGGNVFCHELGEESWNKKSSLPPHITPNLRTYQWDNYEPNEGADTTGDGIPDKVIGASSSLTRYGNFYSYLSSAEDIDAFRIDTGWSPHICLQAPRGRSYKLSVYSYRDRWNNETQDPSADGITDALIWSGESTDGGEICFTAGSIAPPRNGEYHFIAKIESTDGDYSPAWPYWITARK